MKIIYDYMEGLEWQERFQDCEIIMQDSHMTEREKEEFLENFEENSSKVQIGFCVMGGIFSEGIDLKKDRLIGAVIVGTGLPMVCDDRELFRSYYEERESKGFEFAYLYNGMNKVLQSAGRVIRTAEDVGVILLLDERFMQKQYTALFPQEWYPYEIVSLSSMKERLDDFWRQFE
jgi:Rad3-related DNA helicase